MVVRICSALHLRGPFVFHLDCIYLEICFDCGVSRQRFDASECHLVTIEFINAYINDIRSTARGEHTFREGCVRGFSSSARDYD